MSFSLLSFLAVLLLILGGAGWFFRRTLETLSDSAAQHAKLYAVSYIKGTALISIAAGAAFDQAFQSLSPIMQASMLWAPYVIFFWKPIAGGLAVLVAFLDRSFQRANEPVPDSKASSQPTTA